MAQSNSAAEAVADGVLVIDRMFEAPRELVFRLWSRPELIVRWWGPEGLYLSRCEMDFRVGGSWRFTMHSVGGGEYPIHGVYREIVPPSRLSFTYCPEEQGGFETLVEIDFIDRGAQTQMLFRQAPFPDRGLRDGHNIGWRSTLSLLGDYAARLLAGADDLAEPPRSAGQTPDLISARARFAREGGVPEQESLEVIEAGRDPAR